GYRCGRTGECIMELLREGKEADFCKLNAVLTFQEWLDDFAEKDTRQAGEKLIHREIKEIKEQMPDQYPKLKDHLERIKNGERDLYF
ncbi:MAG: [FeFe] hydrogenase H-cluster radical SAM maturase HydG, partial [bacterium]